MRKFLLLCLLASCAWADVILKNDAGTVTIGPVTSISCGHGLTCVRTGSTGHLTVADRASYWYDGGAGYIFAEEGIQNPDGGVSLVVRNRLQVPNGTITPGIVASGTNAFIYGNTASNGYLQWNGAIWHINSQGVGQVNTMVGGLSSQCSSGVNAFSALTNGARFDIGDGVSDYFSSDGFGISTPSYLKPLRLHATGSTVADGSILAAGAICQEVSGGRWVTEAVGTNSVRTGPTNSVGSCGMSQVVTTLDGTSLQTLMADGTAALPSSSFMSDPNTGMYSGGADTLSFSTAGVLRLSIGATGFSTFSGGASIPTNTVLQLGATALYELPASRLNIDKPIAGPVGTAALPAFTFTGDPNTGLYNTGVDQMSVTTGGVASLLFRLTGYISSPALNSNLILTETSASIGTGAGLFTVTATAATSGVPVVLPVGAVGAPSLTFTGDTNTGLYWVGADQLGVTTAGARSFNFNATAGELEGVTSTPKLALNSNGATLTYGTTLMSAQNLLEVHSGATEGIRVTTDNATAWGTTYAQVLQADARDGRMYWTRTATRASTPPFDLGGGHHPVIEQRVYVIDQAVGNGGAATAPFFHIAPRYGSTTVAITVVDDAAGSSSYIGTAPTGRDYRSSVTLASAASTSTVTADTNFINLDHAPRWCQRVRIDVALTTVRVWVGLASALPGSSDTPATSKVGFRYSTGAGDTAWMYCTGNAATTCTTTGVTPATSGNVLDLLCADCREGSACTFWVNGVAIARTTTNLPTSTTVMRPFYTVETLSAAVSRELLAGAISIEMN